MSRFGRIVLVTKRTALEELTERFVTEAQARFYVEHMGLSFEEYRAAHDIYRAALEALRASLPPSPRHIAIERSFLPTFTFDERDLVITLGGNGLVVNTAKYLNGQPILGVSPDRLREDAVLVPFVVADVHSILTAVLRGEFRVRPITMAEARLNDGQCMLAFNDLFIGRRDHASARYRVEHDGRAEDQSSSGIIVSTGAGSTGWMRSVVVGALGIVRALWPSGKELPERVDPRFDWSADHLLFAVREPFPTRRTQAGIVFGLVGQGRPLRVVSRMPEGGVIFSDGVDQDAISFNFGAIATIEVAGRKANLIAG